MPTYQTRSPLFGEYFLIPHPVDEDPGPVMLGYVVFDGEPVKLRRAIRLDREDWRDDKGRLFAKPIIAWYSLEKPDGSPLFG